MPNLKCLLPAPEFLAIIKEPSLLGTELLPSVNVPIGLILLIPTFPKL